jgi:hypothetical protein
MLSAFSSARANASAAIGPLLCPVSIGAAHRRHTL